MQERQAAWLEYMISLGRIQSPIFARSECLAAGLQVQDTRWNGFCNGARHFWRHRRLVLLKPTHIACSCLGLFSLVGNKKCWNRQGW